MHLGWIQKETGYLFVFSPNTRKYGPVNLRTPALLTHCRAKTWLIEVNSKYTRGMLMLSFRCLFTVHLFMTSTRREVEGCEKNTVKLRTDVEVLTHTHTHTRARARANKYIHKKINIYILYGSFPPFELLQSL